MLDMGFFDDIMQIVKQMPTKRQTILFSATLPPKIRQLAKQILKDPAEINIAISKPNEAIIQSAYICYETQKMAIIQELFSKPNRKKTIIFSSSKQKVLSKRFSASFNFLISIVPEGYFGFVDTISLTFGNNVFRLYTQQLQTRLQQSLRKRMEHLQEM